MQYKDSHLIARARRAPRLTQDEERELLRKWQQERDQKAANRIAECTMRNVVAVAFKFNRYEVALETLIAEGNVGLVRAMDKFDVEREVRFSTYATYWIRSFIIEYIMKNWSVVGGGSGALKTRTFFQLRREAARAWSLCGDSDGVNAMIARRMDIPEEKVGPLRQQIEKRDISLHTPVHEDASTTLMDNLDSGDANADRVERARVLERVSPALKDAVSQLNSREQFIVKKRLMADSGDALSLSTIASLFGVSRERVRQIEQRLKERLRQTLSGKYTAEDLVAA